MVDEAETILFLLKSQTQHLSTVAIRQRLLLNLNIPVIKFFNPFLDYNNQVYFYLDILRTMDFWNPAYTKGHSLHIPSSIEDNCAWIETVHQTSLLNFMVLLQNHFTVFCFNIMREIVWVKTRMHTYNHMFLFLCVCVHLSGSCLCQPLGVDKKKQWQCDSTAA